MQKRLTAKDWILYTLIAVLITLLLLVMYQIDRQWLRLTEMQTALQAQAKDMRDLRSAVSSGTLARSENAATATTTPAVAAAFNRAHAMTQQAGYAQATGV